MCVIMCNTILMMKASNVMRLLCQYNINDILINNNTIKCNVKYNNITMY